MTKSTCMSGLYDIALQIAAKLLAVDKLRVGFQDYEDHFLFSFNVNVPKELLEQMKEKSESSIFVPGSDGGFDA